LSLKLSQTSFPSLPLHTPPIFRDQASEHTFTHQESKAKCRSILRLLLKLELKWITLSL